MTISSSVFAAFLIAAAAELLFPVILLLVLCLKKIISPKPMFIGAAAFFVSQLCLRLPLLQAVSTQGWFRAFALNAVPYIIMLSVTAGLFEESARYLCAGCFLKKERCFRDALAFGLGHGFCEVVLLTGMAQINNIIYTVMINSGSFAAATSKLPAAASQQILSAMASATPPLIYLGILERVFAVTFHIFASVLIFKGVNEHKIRFYFLAMAAHALFNLGSVLLTQYVNAWAGEGFALAAALAALFLIFRMKPSFQREITTAEHYEQVINQQ